MLVLALPGGTYLYQGEELGLEEVEDIPDELLQDPTFARSGGKTRGRDGCRVPLPWEGEAPPFGFGADGSQPWLPQPAHWRDLTAAAQVGDPDSMLTFYRHALALRRAMPALGDGSLRWLETPTGVLGFAREPGFACLVNYSDEPVPLPESGRVVLASAPLAPTGMLPGNSAVWLDEV
jgi:alpha-glucosidase